MLVVCALGATAIAAATGSCTTPSSEAPNDAAPDLRRRDVGSDTSKVGDTGPDVDPGFLDGWVPAPWANPPCQVYQPGSKDVLTQVQPLKWQACSSGRAGCEEIVHDWTTQGSINSIGGWWAEVNGAAVMWVERAFSASENEFLLYQDDVLVWAWRYLYTGITGCIAGGGGPSGGVPLLEAIVRDSQKNLVRYLQLVEPAGSAMSVTGPTYDFDTADAGFGGLVAHGVASTAIVAMWSDQSGQVAIRERGPNILHTFYGDPTNYSDDFPVVVGDSVFYASGGAGKVFMYTPKSGMQVLRQSYSDVTVHDVASDGTTVAWTESTGGDGGASFAASTLYVSPYTHGSTALNATPLDTNLCNAYFCSMTMSQGYLMAVGYGGKHTGSSNLYRLADHTRWILSPLNPSDQLGTGVVIKGKLWVSSQALGGLSGIERIDLNALGAGQTTW